MLKLTLAGTVLALLLGGARFSGGFRYMSRIKPRFQQAEDSTKIIRRTRNSRGISCCLRKAWSGCLGSRRTGQRVTHAECDEEPRRQLRRSQYWSHDVSHRQRHLDYLDADPAPKRGVLIIMLIGSLCLNG